MNRAMGTLITKLYWLLAVATVLVLMILFFINTIDPVEAGPLGVLVLFALLYIFSLSVCFLIVRVLVLVWSRLNRNKRSGMSNNKAYYIASVVAFLPVFLLAIRSLGQLRGLDVVLVVLFITIAVFYVNRRS